MINRNAAVNRRQVLLAVGGLSLISVPLARLPQSAPDHHRPGPHGSAGQGSAGQGSAGPAGTGRTGTGGAGTGHADTGYSADGHRGAGHQPAGPGPDGRDRPHRRRTDSEPPYPPDQPLYYIDDDDKAIALTIDDGPNPVYTPQVLALLRQYQVTATFSMIGMHVAAYPDVARAVAGAGHLIANHTWDHADLAGLRLRRVHRELTRASETIHTVTGVHPTLFRAPYGAWTPGVLRQCERMRMIPLDWSVDPRDWARPGVRHIVRNIMTKTQPGSIILEHDGGGNRAQTVAALRIVLPRLLHEGYHFRTP